MNKFLYIIRLKNFLFTISCVAAFSCVNNKYAPDNIESYVEDRLEFFQEGNGKLKHLDYAILNKKTKQINDKDKINPFMI